MQFDAKMTLQVMTMISKKKIVIIFPNIALGSSTVIRAMYKFFTPSHFMHIGIAYIAAVLEREGYDVKIIDATVERLSHDALERIIKAFAPDVVGITSNVANASVAVETSIICRKAIPSARIILGGPWATINWKYLAKNGYADVVVIGEGEETIAELMKALDGGGDARYQQIKGIAFKAQDGTLKKNTLRPFNEALDSLPFPAWHLFPDPRKYNFPFRRTVAFPIITSRGCPFNCNFCSKFVHGFKIRYRSVESVIKEIRFLKEKFHADELYIIDDNFTMDVNRASKILDRIIEEKFHMDITLSNGVRADTLTPELLIKMRRAGVVDFAVGLESGNQQVLNKIGKSLSLKKVRAIVPTIHELGFTFKTFFMIGHPYDTASTMMDTIMLAIELNPDVALFSKTTPWPGTRLYELVKNEGHFIRKKNQIRSFNVYESQFKIFKLTPRLVNKYFMLAYLSFYLRLTKIRSLIKKITTWPQLKWYISNSILFLLRFFFK